MIDNIGKQDLKPVISFRPNNIYQHILYQSEHVLAIVVVSLEFPIAINRIHSHGSPRLSDRTEQGNGVTLIDTHLSARNLMTLRQLCFFRLLSKSSHVVL